MRRNSFLESDPNYVPARKSKKKIAGNVIYYVIGVLISLVFVFPLFYMFSTSTKSDDAIAQAQAYNKIMMFFPDFRDLPHWFDNYQKLFVEYEIWKYALNSFIYAAIIIVFNVIVNGLAGYALAKFNFPGKKFFMFIILFLIVVPVETSIIPLWLIVSKMLGLVNGLSVFAIVLPAIVSIFNIFLFTQFFSSIPKEYEEAMHIDGASRLRIFFDLILPLSKPIVAATMVFTFIGVWNDFVWPKMMLPHPQEGEWPLLTIQIILFDFKANPATTAGQAMASMVITSVPIFILYAAAQKYIVKGFGTAGLKM